MILYLDTSALIKLILDETGSAAAKDWFDHSDVVAASVIAFAEGCAALGRRHRYAENSSDLDTCIGALGAIWTKLMRISVDEQSAGRLALAHHLRGMDAIHLQAAIDLRSQACGNGSAGTVTLLTFDHELSDAAEREGFATLGGDID